MTNCANLEAFLDRNLDTGRKLEFEAHLPVCPGCRQEVERFRAIEQGLSSWAAHLAGMQPTALSAHRLVEKARARRRRVPSAAGWRWAAAALAGVLAAGMAWVILHEPRETTVEVEPEPLALTISQGMATTTVPHGSVPGTLLDAEEENLRARLGDHRLALSSPGRVQVLQADRDRTRLRLEAGELALEVEPGRGQLFEVGTDDCLVRVVGTRLVLAARGRGCPTVSVLTGSVVVLSSRMRIVRVEAGQRLSALPGAALRLEALEEGERHRLQGLLEESGGPTLPEQPSAVGLVPRRVQGRSLSPPEASPGPTNREKLALLRALVLQGDYPAAEAELVALLRDRPTDVEAWSLLADSRRKAGRWRAAVEAYQTIIALGDSTEKNRARLLAAAVLQERLGDHAAAVEMLRNFLSEAPGVSTLQSAAKIRLARSLHALGDRESAERLLQEVLSERPGTPEAREARNLLDQWRRQPDQEEAR